MQNDGRAFDNKRYDVAVIGGGAVGLATAMALSETASVIVLEAEDDLGLHQTGNNSGVIHSGLYYKPGSLKAQLCTSGRELMYRFCAEHGIAHERTGKVVVALDEAEKARLGTLIERGRANGLGNLRMMSMEEIRTHEPNVAGMAGIYCSETGIADYRAVARAFGKVIESRGGAVARGAGFVGLREMDDGEMILRTRVRTGAGVNWGEVRARMLVNCAGLQSDRVARKCGIKPGVQIVPFRGEYYELTEEAAGLVKNLIYPVPDPSFPFLGVHFTRMANGGVEAGPNAVLALARHGYSWRHIDLRDLAQTLGFGGFWKMARQHWKTGMGEMHRSVSKKAFWMALRRLMPGLEMKHLKPGGAGVRAQAMRSDGKMVDDFHIQSARKMVHVLNAPSPAATASIAIGRYIAELARRVMV